LLTDEARLAVGTAAGAYQAAAKQGEGGGTASATLVNLTVATLARGYAEVVVANAAISPASKVSAWFAPALDAENDLEELVDSGMAVWVLPEAGQLRFVLTGNGAFVGVYSVFYEVLL
jgi:hypothetical protein